MRDSKIDFAFYNLKNRLSHSLKNPRFFTHYFSKFSQYSSPSKMDGFLISYPKSGRTWLQRIIVETIINESKLIGPIKDIYDLNQHVSNFPRIVATHRGSCWEENLNVLNADEIKRLDDSQFLLKKTVFMCRDPRDVLVSQLFHLKYRTGIKQILKKDVIESELIGLKKQVAFINKWYKYHNTNSDNVFLLTYEKLHVSTFESVKSIMAFWNIHVSDHSIKIGIANASFQKMRSKEGRKTMTPWNYTPNTANQNSYHARKGEIGGYKNFFNNDELEQISNFLLEHLDPMLQQIWM